MDVQTICEDTAASGLRPVARHRPLAALSRMGPKVVAGISDQALTSGASAAINFALARWLSAEEYGVFCLGFTIFLIAAGLHNSLVLEPVSVLGASRFDRDTRVYLRNVFYGQLALSLVVAGLLAAVALGVPMGGPSRIALLGAAILSPPILTIWYLRRIQYLLATPHKAAAVSALYAVGLIVFLGVAQQKGHLSAVTSFALMGAAAALASGPCFRLALVRGSQPSFGAVAGAHWGFGKWFVAASVLSVGTNQIQLLVVASCIGMAGTGALRAMMNFALPLSQLATALSNLALPSMARTYMEHPARFKAAATKLILGYGAGGFVYMVALTLLGRRLEALVYGGKFSASAGTIPILGVWIFAMCVSAATGVVLRARQAPRAYFLTYFAASAFGFITAVPLVRMFGVSGAALSMAGTYIVGAVVQIVAFRKALDPQRVSPSEEVVA